METLLAPEIASQISPSLIVYERTQSPAKTAKYEKMWKETVVIRYSHCQHFERTCTYTGQAQGWQQMQQIWRTSSMTVQRAESFDFSNEANKGVSGERIG